MLTVDLATIAANWRALAARHGPGRDTAAVLKADGYGLGAGPIGARLQAEGCRHFFTAHLAEAVALRRHVREGMIAVLHGVAAGEETVFTAYGLLPVLGSEEEIARWQEAAFRAGRVLPALLHIDTGMNRTGLTPAEAEALAAEPDRMSGIALRYVMTHLVSADSPASPLNAAQAARFAELAAGFPGVKRSFANSSGLFLGPGFASDLARPGAALYGLNPTPGQPNPMQPVARLDVRVLQLRAVPPGSGVGYDHQWVAARPSRIATLPLGYADGYARALGNRAQISFGGRLCPVVGRVSMDLITVDVTDCPDIGVGDWGSAIGPDLAPDDLAALAGTNGYDILTSLGSRFHRVYLNA